MVVVVSVFWCGVCAALLCDDESYHAMAYHNKATGAGDMRQRKRARVTPTTTEKIKKIPLDLY